MNSATIAAMAGGGQYNRHSRLQLANLQSALPLWEHAAAAVGQDSAGLEGYPFATGFPHFEDYLAQLFGQARRSARAWLSTTPRPIR